MGEDDDVCVDFWVDVYGAFYCGVFAEVEVLEGERFYLGCFMAMALGSGGLGKL